MSCLKIAYPSKKAAEKDARSLSVRKFGGWRRGSFVKTYECPECTKESGRSVWHMTRSKPRRQS